jgi:hypothetical protein
MRSPARPLAGPSLASALGALLCTVPAAAEPGDRPPPRSTRLELDLDLRSDLLWSPPDLRPPPPLTHLQAAGPKVVYLWYADGGAPPVNARPCQDKIPPVYHCEFGRSLADCQRQVQAWLDKWYADFNVVFTLTRPAVGPYYTAIVASSGVWCGQGPTVGGVAPINCRDLEDAPSYSFLCGRNPKACAAIIAQEHAHTVGLVHSTSRVDVMYPSVQLVTDGFEDRENTVADILCRKTQNSYRLMLERMGPWPGGAKPSPFGATPPMQPTPPPMQPAPAPNAGGMDPQILGHDERVVHGGCAVGMIRRPGGGALPLPLVAVLLLGLGRPARGGGPRRGRGPGAPQERATHLARRARHARLLPVLLVVLALHATLDLAFARAEAPLEVIAPRVIAFGASAAAVGRHFGYNASLQREETFARPGVAVDLESFPFAPLASPIRGLGLALLGAKEVGHAELQQAAFLTQELAVVEDRVEARLQWALTAAPGLVFVPSFGFGRSRFEIEGATARLPSECVNTSTEICLPRTSVTHLGLGLGARIALARVLGLHLEARYLQGLATGRALGTLGGEAAASTYGLAADAHLRVALTPYFGASAGLGLLWFRHSFRTAGAYSRASELYPFGRVGLWVATGP